MKHNSNSVKNQWNRKSIKQRFNFLSDRYMNTNIADLSWDKLSDSDREILIIIFAASK